ncbi:hypothetical protein [Gracilimonas tropica]|uniref:hypothetical protein n=1 Tax=Gracilimonas tropica TaxID=454600 RepID=UPI00036C29BD|nr:hypothetical protein [Gracilimonas tropica]
MLKFIFFSIVFFFLVRYINRLFLPSNKRQQQFDPFRGGSRSGFRRKKHFDEIEEAEYEDLSNKDN